MADAQRLDIPEFTSDTRLAGRTAIVTGAGSAGEMGGTGSDIAVLLAAKGANVMILDVDEARAWHTAEAVERVGGTCLVAIADITEQEECEDAVDKCVREFGGVDILVNNAAIAPGEQENLRSMWDKIIALNLTAVKLMSDAVLPSMFEKGAGSIIHITSVAGLRAGGGIGYSASKGGLIAMAKAQAYEYGPRGVRVNTVAPGHVAIPMGLGFAGWNGGGTGEMRRRRAKATMLGTEGTGWDVAFAVLYLASDEASYVTGHTIPVDGGTTEVFPIVMAETIVGDGSGSL
ncbi:MAG: NAD(P)-dependent dehydrogenase, short-chain alcohol dehydrogenase family [Subtercola sp.]|nr:NAD(P)-dependent dehydrogenase, short-chain alcohol dehydrogenase family [Subtercola sp.]